MRTADLPVGAHVAFNSYKSTTSSNFVEAFVVGHRPKGNKSSYWGSRTGNTDTICIATTRPYWKDEDGRPTWRVEWVRPADIHMTWDKHLELEAKYKASSDAQMAKRKAAKADRKARFDALPSGVREMFSDYKRDDLIDRESTMVQLSVDMIERIVAIAQAEVPERKDAKVAAEVKAALALL